MVITFQNKGEELPLGQEDDLDSSLLSDGSQHIKHSFRGIKQELLEKHRWS
jgi:hypothetical protein